MNLAKLDAIKLEDMNENGTSRVGGMSLPKWLIPVGIIAILAVVLYSFFVGRHNKIVDLEEQGVKKQWANVESAYQKRADEIGNLVSTVKGAADFERETLEGVIKARAEATKMNIDVNNLDASALSKFQEVQGGLSDALSKLMVVVERYPELTATENFKDLQRTISSIEGEVSMERQKYNEKAADYNSYVKKFPTTMVASLWGHDSEKPLFEAQAGTDEAPEVSFD